MTVLRSLLAITCGFVFFLLSLLSNASSYSFSDPNISLFSDGSLSADVININPPNSIGLSINRFSRFSVESKPILIANTNAGGYPGPVTIVIIANSIELKNAVEVLGPTADVLFVSESSSGSVTCTSCSLKNVYRATMAVSRWSLNFNGALDINAAPNGVVSINSMSAPGLMALDVVSGVVNTSGTLYFHDKVNKSNLGGYQRSNSGRYTMGSASVNLIVGSSTWNYYSQKIKRLLKSSSESNISGNFRTLSFKVSTGAPLMMTANIDTRSDVVTTLRYRGSQMVSKERVLIDSMSNSSLSLSTDITSNGNVDVRTLRSLTLNSGVDISGYKVNIIAEGELTNYGKIKAESASDIAASYVFNEGSISSNASTSVWADHIIANRYGGLIKGHSVNMQTEPSNNGYIINGSRTPFEYYSSSLLNINEDYFESIDETKFGTYYVAGIHNLTNLSNMQMPANSSAHILGKTIAIKSTAFENINPYYEVLESSTTELQLKRDLLTQVSVLAEDSLKISTDRYIVNSSAYLGTQNASSKVFLESGVVANERYRVLTVLDQDELNHSYYNSDGNHVSDTGTRIFTRPATFSPPGMMFSMGDFESHTSFLFLNSTGYFEIFGEAKFSSPKLRDAGIANNQVQKNLRVLTVMADESQGTCAEDAAFCDQESEREFVAKPRQMDSLFYVAGAIKASNVEETIVFDYYPFNTFIDQAVADILSLPKYANLKAAEPYYYGGRLYEVARSDVGVVVNIYGEDGEFANSDGTFDIHWWENKKWEHVDDSADDDEVFINREGVDTYSIFEVLKDLYDNLVDTLANLLSEIKWWD